MIIEWQGKEEDKTVDWLTNSEKLNTYDQRQNTNESSGRLEMLKTTSLPKGRRVRGTASSAIFASYSLVILST